MEGQLSIIPKPVSIKYEEGTYRCSGLPRINGDDEFKNEIETVREQLRVNTNEAAVPTS